MAMSHFLNHESFMPLQLRRSRLYEFRILKLESRCPGP